MQDVAAPETASSVWGEDLPLRCRRAGLDMPPRLTVDPEKDKAAYDKWRHEIDLLREAAGIVTKTKPLAPA